MYLQQSCWTGMGKRLHHVLLYWFEQCSYYAVTRSCSAPTWSKVAVSYAKQPTASEGTAASSNCVAQISTAEHGAGCLLRQLLVLPCMVWTITWVVARLLLEG